jgi:hypothetical protein
VRGIHEHETRYPLSIFRREDAHAKTTDSGSDENDWATHPAAVEQPEQFMRDATRGTWRAASTPLATCAPARREPTSCVGHGTTLTDVSPKSFTS